MIVLVVLCLFLSPTIVLYAQSSPSDSTKKEEEIPYRKSPKPNTNINDRYGDNLSNKTTDSPLILKNPSNIQQTVELDETGKGYIIKEKSGEFDYRPPTRMTYEQYERYKRQKDLKQYWKSQSKKEDEAKAGQNSPRRIIPPIYVSPKFDRIFGGNYIDIKPNGNVMLDFGGQYQRTDNPALPIRQQRNGGFNFNQTIALNVQGKIGEKLKIAINWDTKAQFDFDNNIKLTYTGMDHDIIKTLEAGNVSMPLSTQLITGSQSLFGIKSQLQFGRLKVTTILANQRGKTESVNLSSNGSQGRPIEINCKEYEENKHYFLAQFFRENYESWLGAAPSITSTLNITRVDVYVTNQNSTTDRTKNIIAFSDLGESNPTLSKYSNGGNSKVPDTKLSNNLFNNFIARREIDLRNVNSAEVELKGDGMLQGRDYEILSPARALVLNKDFKFNAQLGYISLLTQLRTNDVLAVAFEFTYNGQTYSVGEVTGNQTDSSKSFTFVKLLKPNDINARLTSPMWDLMMKNVYSLGINNISSKGFQMRVVYKDDASGVDNPSLQVGRPDILRNVPLVSVLNADKFNQNRERIEGGDGYYDFLNNITLDSVNGRLIFPVLEPFGSHLLSKFDPVSEVDLAKTYVFQEIYDSIKSRLLLFPSKSKFYISGNIQSNASSEISLNGINIAPGSVRVTSGSRQLQENVDYTVNYDLGRVKIINEGLLTSGSPISVNFEKADLFNFRSKSLMGTRLEYTLSKDMYFGATVMHLNERPLITRVATGDEPLRNTMAGFDFAYKKESRLITKIIDKLPLISTKAPSVVNLKGEYARLMPSVSPIIGKDGNAFIDDFEGSRNPFDLTRSPSRWRIAAPPIRFRNGKDLNDLAYGYQRAKLAWYNVDNIFFSATGRGDIVPSDIVQNGGNRHHYTRIVGPQELFPNRSQQAATINEPTLDLAYFPYERGQYNFNPNLNENGLLVDPAANFGGITRPITFNTDFEDGNIQYLEFWMMDPFLSGANGGLHIKSPYTGNDTVTYNTKGGSLYFNIGNVSEDVLRDGRHAFENGLPVADDQIAQFTDNNVWGRVTKSQYLNDAFSITPGARNKQDKGLDGLNSSEENSKYQNFINSIQNAPIKPNVKQNILADPSNDDFKYYLGDAQNGFQIIDRYKYYNGLENNSPESSGGSLVASSYTTPDNEDLNKNNTIDANENYFEYKINVTPQGLEKGQNYIIDKRVTVSNGENVTWYQFRIPIRDPAATRVGAADLKAIQFCRMYLTDFIEPVVLRLAQFQFVAGQWRPFLSQVPEAVAQPVAEPANSGFNVSTVNAEENTGYVTPPGFVRDRDNTSNLNRVLNEQSLRLCVSNLKKTGQAVYKETNKLNAINYERIKMFIHAESDDILNTEEGQVRAFIRFGTDLVDNYYEVEIPLRTSQKNNTSAFEVWPAENELDVALADLTNLKKSRKEKNPDIVNPMSREEKLFGKNIYSVKGNPDLTDIKNIMIGIRNPLDGKRPEASFCVWVNELRFTGFNQKGSDAAIGSANFVLADLATVSLSGKYEGIGFGQIEQKISSRSTRETINYGVSAGVNLSKLLPPQLGLKLPMQVDYTVSQLKPKFDPTNPDVKLESSAKTQEDPEAYTKLMTQKTVFKSINFTNVQKTKTKKDAKKHIYDIENVALTVAYSETNRTDYNIETDVRRVYRGGLTYTYAITSKPVEPLKSNKSKFVNSPYLKIVKDFNFSPLPSNIAFRADMSRLYSEQQLRNGNLNTEGILPTYDKSWTLDRNYNLRWAFTKSLSMDYIADVKAIIDEPQGRINRDTVRGREITKRDSVIKNLQKFGRIKTFNQNISFNYKVPLDKIPMLDWINADTRYTANYIWNAGSLGIADSLGNNIQNSRTQSVNGRIDLSKLYNKAKFLKEINNQTGAKKPPRTKLVFKTRSNGQIDTIKVKLPEYKVLKGVLKKIMSVKSVNFTYEVTDGTSVPGFMPKTKYLGMDDAFDAPGFPFILGQQGGIKQAAADGDWITHSRLLTDRFKQNRNVKFTAQTQIEPIKDFRIQINASKTKTGLYEEQFKDTTFNGTGRIQSYSPSRSGTYQISFISIHSAFHREDRTKITNYAFEQYRANREIIKDRLMSTNPNSASNKTEGGGTYDLNGPDVLIPSFIAAYSGQDVNKVALNPFPNIPMPNWRVDYGGLSNIGKIKKYFSSMTLTHSYTSTYSVNNYKNDARYDDAGLLSLRNQEEFLKPVETRLINTQSDSTPNSFVPVYVIGDVTIRENFAPLIGINAKTKKNISMGFQFKKDRSLTLNIANNGGITEIKGNDFAINMGYIKTGLKLPIKTKGRIIVLKNETNMRLDITIRDQKTIQRNPDGINQFTAGQMTILIRPNITYVVNQRLNLQLYYERSVTRPYISSSFRRINTLFGVQVRFTLN